jgi:hypothetical protein
MSRSSPPQDAYEMKELVEHPLHKKALALAEANELEDQANKLNSKTMLPELLHGDSFGRPPSRESEYLPYWRTVFNVYQKAIKKYEEAGDTDNADRLKRVASDISRNYIYRDDNSAWSVDDKGSPINVFGRPFEYKNLGGKKSKYVRKSKSKHSRKSKSKSKHSRKSKSKSKYSRKY